MKKQVAVVAFAMSTRVLAAGVGDEVDVDALKRWYMPSFSFEVVDTSAFMPRDMVVEAMGDAAAAWNAVGVGTEIRIVETTTDQVTHPVALDGVNRVGVWADGAWPYPEMAGAVTLVYSARDSDEIAEVDIALNPAFAWTLDPLDEEGKFDLANVLTHEVGHSLGLPDVKDQREASMFYVILRGETLKRDLSKGDEDMLLELYEGIEPETAQGCHAAGQTSALTALGLLALIIRRRK